jgi:N utilization substance protein A
MPRRKQKHKIDKKMIIDAFQEMAKDKSIDRDLLQGILEETLSMIVRKKYGLEANFDIIVNMEKGDIEIFLIREVVEEVEDDETQISVEEANKYSEEELESGEEFVEEITLDNLAENFGRRLISLASQNLNQRIREVEKDNVYNEYITKLNEIIIGEIYQVRRHDILILHNKIEMRLPREEQIPNEPYRYKKNQTIKAIVKEVNRTSGGNQPEIILSRASEDFLARLFEIEIPEIYDGIIQIKAIARDPGERSKVAVTSFDDRVDPVGACVGMKGIRIHSIVRELNNENIDLIEYSDDPRAFITRALSPAKVREIQLSPETMNATVVVPDDQVSLAIGKNGQNVRLASKLTGYALTLMKEGGEDIDLIEFREELGLKLYRKLAAEDIETAREFLETDVERLLSIEGMSKELLLDLRKIILSEFEEQEKPEVVEQIKNAQVDKQKTTKTDDSPAKDIDDILKENSGDSSSDMIDVAQI